MPSENRLHPASILFGLVSQLREFAVPLILAVVAGSRGGNIDTVALVVLVPYTVVAMGRFYWFRYRFEPHELVVRSGFIVRNERHIPYGRIQNLDAVQNVLHRAFDVVDVRVDTGSGAEADARLSVVTWEAYRTMRQHVFAGRQPEAAGAGPEALAGPRADVLLDLPARELVLHGLIENRGGIIIAGFMGLLVEAGVVDRVVDRFADDEQAGGSLRRFVAGLGSGGEPLWERIALVALAGVALLAVIRVLSVALALVRLHAFKVVRLDEDLRTEYGLLTRVSATIPLRRIQTVTVTERLLHRLFRRASVRVDTAGGREGRAGARRHESLAPIIGAGQWPAFVRQVIPELDLSRVDWQPPAPGALARETRARLILAALVSAPIVAFSTAWALAAFAGFGGLAVLTANRYVAHLGWAVVDGAVLFRSGWLSRDLSIARFTRIQSVAMRASPFDRRWSMARVSVDTAGAGTGSHRVDIPYLRQDVAADLHGSLSAAAARTAFQW